MKVLMLIIVVFFVVTNIFSQEVYFDDHWKDVDEKLLNLVQFKEILNRMTRKSGPRQFFGLMGKRANAKTQTRKRQKFLSFVGLMGKRSSDEQSTRFHLKDTPLH